MSKYTSLIILTLLVCIIDPVYAQAPGQPMQQPSFGATLMSMLPMIAICYLIFFFMVIKPQATKVKTHEALIAALKRGDTVVTSGGIVGKVSGNEKDYLLIEVSSGVKLKIEPGHIARKLEEGGKSSEAAA